MIVLCWGAVQDWNLIAEGSDRFAFRNVLIVFVAHDALVHHDGNRRGRQQIAFVAFCANFIIRRGAFQKSLDSLLLESLLWSVLVIVGLAGRVQQPNLVPSLFPDCRKQSLERTARGKMSSSSLTSRRARSTAASAGESFASSAIPCVDTMVINSARTAADVTFMLNLSAALC